MAPFEEPKMIFSCDAAPCAGSTYLLTNACKNEHPTPMEGDGLMKDPLLGILAAVEHRSVQYASVLTDTQSIVCHL